MTTALNFDTPNSCTTRTVPVTGTVAARSLSYLTIKLNVINAVTPARNRSFYRVLTYNNTTRSTPQVVNNAYNLSIVPKLLGSDTIGYIYRSFRKCSHRINTYRNNYIIFIRFSCCAN